MTQAPCFKRQNEGEGTHRANPPGPPTAWPTHQTPSRRCPGRSCCFSRWCRTGPSPGCCCTRCVGVRERWLSHPPPAPLAPAPRPAPEHGQNPSPGGTTSQGVFRVCGWGSASLPSTETGGVSRFHSAVTTVQGPRCSQVPGSSQGTTLPLDTTYPLTRPKGTQGIRSHCSKIPSHALWQLGKTRRTQKLQKENPETEKAWTSKLRGRAQRQPERPDYRPQEAGQEDRARPSGQEEHSLAKSPCSSGLCPPTELPKISSGCS